MPKQTGLQDSFSSGEISPKLFGRVQAPGYQSGVQVMENFVADSRGPVRRRIGTQYIAEIAANKGRMSIFTGVTGAYFFFIYTDLLLTVLDSTGAVVTTEVTPWLEDEIDNIHVAEAPGGTFQYLAHPNHPQYKIVYDPVGGTFSFTIVTFTSPPSHWVPDNYPRTAVFHQGRLWFGGTPNEPQTFWGSKSGVYEDFTTGSLADDSLIFTMAKVGAIRWMESTKNLLIGTSSGEHIVTSEAGVITPGDISITQQSAYGSAGIQTIQVGDQILYVSPDTKKLRAMQYEWSADNWLSQDLTFFSEHITRDGISNMTWAQNPDNQFMCGLKDGTLAILTYERGENIFGWHHHDLSDDVQSAARGAVLGTDLKAFLVNRAPGKLYVETEPQEIENYLDSWVEQINGSPSDTVTGLEHLEGRTVGVVANDAVHPDRVVTGGQIVLDFPVDKAVVGLNFRSTMKTLPLDRGAQAGSAQPHLKRHNKIFVTLLESNNPLINGERQPTRFPSTPMDTAEQPRTGRSFVAETGWDRDAQITIEQDLPVPCTIISIATETEQNIL